MLRYHDRALAAGIAILPAVGMDVVPSDCLAARLAEALPRAVRLELAFGGMASVSHGTAATIWENIGRGGRVRQDGRIVRVPAAWKVQEIPFPRGPQWAMTIPWGDVASAFHTTGIPNIEVYAAVPARQLTVLRRFRWMARLAGIGVVQSLGQRWIDRRIKGPSEPELTRGRTEFWGRVTDEAGRVAQVFNLVHRGAAEVDRTASELLQHPSVVRDDEAAVVLRGDRNAVVVGDPDAEAVRLQDPERHRAAIERLSGGRFLHLDPADQDLRAELHQLVDGPRLIVEPQEHPLGAAQGQRDVEGALAVGDRDRRIRVPPHRLGHRRRVAPEELDPHRVFLGSELHEVEALRTAVEDAVRAVLALAATPAAEGMAVNVGSVEEVAGLALPQTDKLVYLTQTLAFAFLMHRPDTWRFRRLRVRPGPRPGPAG